MKRFFPLLSALLAATTIGAYADPADPSQPGISVVYRSSFDGYLPHQNGIPPSLEKWRAANDLVGSLGGHAGHIEATTPSHDHSGHQPSAPQTTPATAPASEQGGHQHAH